jgi:HD superfamily phosphohydrolase
LFDLEWVIKSLAVDEENDRIYVTAPGLYAVEEYLQARYYMFRQVYFHRSLRSAEVVLKAVLRRALALAREGRDIWRAPGTAFAKVLEHEPLTLREHLEMDDSDVIFHVKQWQRAEDAILRDLSRRFVNRRLFKALDLDMPEESRGRFLAAARRCVERAGFDPEYYFREDRAGDVPYYFYTAEGAAPKTRIYVQDGYAQPQIREISEVSAAVRGLQRGYQLHRVCFPAEIKEQIYTIYHQ